MEQKKKRKRRGRVGRAISRTLLVILETLLLLVGALYGVMYVVAKGPSPTASKLFVNSVRETSAIGFLADLFFSEDEIKAMMSSGEITEYVPTDKNLISIDTGSEPQNGGADAYGLVDDDGDGIIIEPVTGEGYSGYMMVVLDPSRVILATCPDKYGSEGYSVEEYVKMFDAVAGINGGAFEDGGGMGNGSTPRGLVVYEGTQYYGPGVEMGFAGIDAEHILNVGCRSAADAAAANIQYGASYGPVLVSNGQMMDESTLAGGLNPRTAIGQRADGAMLLLVIDGRQVISLGATYYDLAEVMMSFGAVNAVNLDGGSSSLMWFEDDYVNNCASVVGIRDIPTAFVVLKK